MYVLGIDGGGTKTSGVVADEQGHVYMQALGGSSNQNTVTPAEFEEMLYGLLAELEQQDPAVFSQLTICFAGMSGVEESCWDNDFVNLLKKKLPRQTEVVVRNDAYNALYSGTLGYPGIVQIAGTGSITFGINYEEEKARCGGWGYLIDDSGSGFNLGNEALRAIFANHDERGPETMMTKKILSHFGVHEIPELVGKIYGFEHPQVLISKLSPIVTVASEAGDGVASGIICEACKEMMKCIEVCHSKLFEPDHPTVIVLSGGVFTNPSKFIWYLNELCKETLPNIIFRETRVAPVGGAVIGGLKAMGITSIDETFVGNMNRHVKK